jgi:phospholipid transport system substrate-binding protein
MRFQKSFRAVALFTALAFAAPLALASDAEGFVKTKHGELTQMVKKAKGPADEKKVEEAFDRVLDYETLAHESLKEFWAERTPEERAEFQAVLTKLVRAAYRKNLKRIGDYQVEYKGESKGDWGQVVRTVARSRQASSREEPVSIDYVVRENAGAFRIVDIVTEGSSLVGNYRSQFRRIIKKQGFPELIRRMKTKLEKGDVE